MIDPIIATSKLYPLIDDHIFIAYHPQLGMPTISFLMLHTAGGRPTLQGFSDFLVVSERPEPVWVKLQLNTVNIVT